MDSHGGELFWFGDRSGSTLAHNSLELTINDVLYQWNQRGPVTNLSPGPIGRPASMIDNLEPTVSRVTHRKQLQYQCAKGSTIAPVSPPMAQVPLSKSLVDDSSCYKLEELQGCYVDFSRDQYGSRFLQREMEVAGITALQMVFEEVLPVIANLMVDAYGNYVVQKFFDFGTDNQKEILASRLQGHVFLLSTHSYGCRVIQKALDNVPSYYQAQILVELQSHLMECIKDQHGNHVIQKCFTSLPPFLLQGMVDLIQKNSVEIAIHPFGCRVMQRLMENCSEEQVEQVWKELLEAAGQLVQDELGLPVGKLFIKSSRGGKLLKHVYT